MRYLCTLLVMLAAASLLCGAAYADASPPSTEGWSLVPVIDGSNINIILGVDNMTDLVKWDGLVSRTWGDPTSTDSSQFVDIGNGVILKSMTASVNGDPNVALQFDVAVTGSGPVTVTFTSPLVSFAPIQNCKGTATAALSVTDCNGDGATATGGLLNGCFYQALCNSPTPQTFCYLIDQPIVCGVSQSNTKNGNLPPWQLMNGAIYNISSQFSFTLSPGDSASGTSNFVVIPVPEPGAIVSLLSGVLGLAGYALRRKIA